MNRVFESVLNTQVYAHYVSACRGDQIPNRRDLDLFTRPGDLPYLYIVDVLARDADTSFKIRLMGTGMVDILRHEGTGQLVRDLPLGGLELSWHDTLLYLLAQRRPIVAIDRLVLSTGLTIALEHLALPLSRDGETIDQVLGAIAFLGYSHERVTAAEDDIGWSDVAAVHVPKRFVLPSAGTAGPQGEG